ncbi:acyl-CoA synthetase [Rhodococcus pyridinivorans]|uniref:acyl-CoA synthetase n=1 Tax=Rhodococcus pyridinivorans TaxID=103816 RepID=UPI00110F512D|nr:acyl-CoA synthetase [Rhodococcus pyridinivorans]UTM38542.1 acyl-CoA synthetase [Rhodococcus pyridinivorans]
MAYKDADGWIYLAGRTADWMRVDGENLVAAPIMTAIVLRDETSLVPEESEKEGPTAGDGVLWVRENEKYVVA